MRKTYLYVLQSIRNGRKYIGVTHNLDERIRRHNDMKVAPSQKYAPYRLIYSEIFSELVLARRRELFFKSGDGRRVLLKKISETR